MSTERERRDRIGMAVCESGCQCCHTGQPCDCCPLHRLTGPAGAKYDCTMIHEVAQISLGTFRRLTIDVGSQDAADPEHPTARLALGNCPMCRTTLSLMYYGQMDPNAAFEAIRKLCQTYAVYGVLDPDSVNRLIANVDSLDVWLSRGGFLPKAWTDESRR